jgi:hypothetical protein
VRPVQFLFLSTAMGLTAQVSQYVPGSATSMVVVSNNQTAMVNTGYTQPLVARVLDVSGCGVASVVDIHPSDQIQPGSGDRDRGFRC